MKRNFVLAEVLWDLSRQPVLSVRIKACTEKVVVTTHRLIYLLLTYPVFSSFVIPAFWWRGPRGVQGTDQTVSTSLLALHWDTYCVLMHCRAHFMPSLVCVCFSEGLVNCYLIKLCYSCRININFRNIYFKCSRARHLRTNTSLITPYSTCLWLCNAFRFELDNLFKIVPQGQLLL